MGSRLNLEKMFQKKIQMHKEIKIQIDDFRQNIRVNVL